MATIFGTPWADLTLDDVRAYLDKADDEPLLWEAKGTKLHDSEIRRQVCPFANSHDGGYLILGAHRQAARPEEPDPRWALDGVSFPGGEPQTWLTEVITDVTAGVRPRPDFDIRAWPTPDGGQVAVVRVTPTSTPPCIANGTVYERLPGKTQQVRDPLRLADLYARGDAARRGARARADEAARTVLDWLGGDAGRFEPAWVPVGAPEDEDEDEEARQEGEDAAHIRFAVGVASTGNPPNISSRLFRHKFAEEVWHELRNRPSPGMPAGMFGRAPDGVTWAQDSLTWRHVMTGLIDTITVVRATWDGAAASGGLRATEDVYPDTLAAGAIRAEWERADELVRRLGGFGDVYVTVLVAGGRFLRRRAGDDYIEVRRGPMMPGIDDEQVGSVGRELMRAVGNPEEEP